VFDIDQLPTHGGSLRLYVCHQDSARHREGAAVGKVRADEKAARLDRLEAYAAFKANAAETRRQLLEFVSTARRAGKHIAAYGAAAKGVILLNYCGLRAEVVEYVVDRNPYKQGRFMPGSHVPICAPSRIAETRPDYLLILPWNLEEEIVRQNAAIRAWGGKFVVPIPAVRVA
jgi:hypothetical protein